MEQNKLDCFSITSVIFTSKARSQLIKVGKALGSNKIYHYSKKSLSGDKHSSLFVTKKFYNMETWKVLYDIMGLQGILLASTNDIRLFAEINSYER